MEEGQQRAGRPKQPLQAVERSKHTNGLPDLHQKTRCPKRPLLEASMTISLSVKTENIKFPILHPNRVFVKVNPLLEEELPQAQDCILKA